MPKIIDLSGKKINHWTVIKRDESAIGKKKYKWICKCDCGKIYSVDGNHLRGSCSTKCIDCKYHGNKGNIPSKIWWQIIDGANKRGLNFDLDKIFLLDLIKKQNYKCAITGLPIGFSDTVYKHNFGETTASLDRIDSSIGYIKSNVQWVHKAVNIMKNRLTTNEFLIICKLTCANNKEKLSNLSENDLFLDSKIFKKDKSRVHIEKKINIVKELDIIE